MSTLSPHRRPTTDRRLTTDRRPTTGASGAVGRVRALARMELTLLGRNKTALFFAVTAPALMVFFLSGVVDDLAGGGGGGAALAGAFVTMLAAFALLLVAYFNLTTTAVARREELMLKRLSTGETSRTEVLLGMSIPAVVIVLGQFVLGLVAVAIAFGMPPMVNPVLLVGTLVLGFAVFALLAFVSSGLTKTVESAQLTTLPMLVVVLVFSGLTFPLTMLPERLQVVGELTPMAPVVTLLRLAVSGTTADGDPVTFVSSFSEALVPLAVLVAWTVVGVVATSRWMRWEPRR